MVSRRDSRLPASPEADQAQQAQLQQRQRAGLRDHRLLDLHIVDDRQDGVSIEEIRIQEGREWLEAARQRLAFLREARERAGLSLEQVAERMGVDKSNLAKLEKAGNPTVETLERYAAALGQRLVITLEPAEGGK